MNVISAAIGRMKLTAIANRRCITMMMMTMIVTRIWRWGIRAPDRPERKAHRQGAKRVRYPSLQMTAGDVQPGISNASLRWLAAAAVVGSAAYLMYWFDRWVGFRSAWFAFNLHFVLMASAHMACRIFEPKFTSRYFNVAPWEPRVYRLLGVIGFMHLLRKIGWTAATRNSLVFDGTRKTLEGYERATRESEFAHGWLFIIAGALVAYAMLRGWWDAALWIGSMNVAFHLYPVMLQRTQRPRLRAMLARKHASVARANSPSTGAVHL